MLAAALASVVYAVAAAGTAQELTLAHVAALQSGGHVLLIRHVTLVPAKQAPRSRGMSPWGITGRISG